MSGHTISILMSVYKESATNVVDSVDSILRQTYTNFEFLIALDDPGNQKVWDYLLRLQETDSRVKVFKNSRNLGLGASLNRLIQEAHGKYIARMDTEDHVYPDKLEKQLAYMQANPRVDLLFTQWEEVFPDKSIVSRKPIAREVQNIQKYFFTKSILLHASMMVKASVLRENHYPAMDRPEDFTLFLDLIRKNYEFDLLEEVLYRYEINPALKYFKVKAFSQNLLPVLYKNIRYFYKNIYFWLYFLRISFEYLISRNKWIYNNTNRIAAKIWRKLFS